MHPAPSVILFTVLSGLGFGLLAFLGLGLTVPAPGWPAFLHWGLGYGLAIGGLSASTFHLGHPERAWRAFSQWQSSWLSREAWASVITLLLLAPMALSDWLGLGWPRLPGQIGAGMCALTVFTTAMIYTQLKTVPRWNHWSTPVLFESFALAGGATLAGQAWVGLYAMIGLGPLMAWSFLDGDTRFARRGQTTGTATGLGLLGEVTVFEQPHTSPNYLMTEMIHVVGRKHAAKLQGFALGLGCVIPALCLLAAALAGGGGATWPWFALAALSHLIGTATQRWLFFAQAEHVVGLFYGKR
jgi:DMSO reductase anchor subunit